MVISLLQEFFNVGLYFLAELKKTIFKPERDKINVKPKKYHLPLNRHAITDNFTE